jgi:hypothetical protein
LRQARRWAHPYRELEAPAGQARFARELAAGGLPEAGLLGAVGQMVRAVHSTFAPAFRPELGRPGDAARSNVAIRLLLELALLASALEGILTESGAVRPSPAWRRPALCPDLWAVCLSHLYEADRRRRFFCLDWLLGDPLRRHAEALGRELGRIGD